MSLFNIISKFRLLSNQLIHQTRSFAHEVQPPRNFVHELQQPRIFSCESVFQNGTKNLQVSESGDGQTAKLLPEPQIAGCLSVCPTPQLFPILDPALDVTGEPLSIVLKDGCKPRCPKKPKCGKKKNKCKKKKNKCKKKKNKCKKKKKKNKCKKKKPKCKPKKKKKKHTCKEPPGCKKKPKCPAKNKCKPKKKCG